jgi:hypothetical protein
MGNTLEAIGSLIVTKSKKQTVHSFGGINSSNTSISIISIRENTQNRQVAVKKVPAMVVDRLQTSDAEEHLASPFEIRHCIAVFLEKIFKHGRSAACTSHAISGMRRRLYQAGGLKENL